MKIPCNAFFFASLLLFCSSTTAQNGTALSLDGISGYMAVPDHDDLNIDAGESFSITLWMKSVNSSDYYRIVNKRAFSGVNPGYEMIVQTGTGAFGMNLRSTANTNAGPPFGTTTVTNGSWHHLTMVVDAANNESSIYVDGNIEQAATSTAIGTESFSNGIPLYFGTNGNQSLFMNVVLDNIRIWGMALDDAQITADMTSTVTGTEPGLIAAWDFENVTGTTVPGLTGAHDGTLSGGAALVTVTSGMVYQQGSIITTSIPAGRGEDNERIIGVNVITQGSNNPLSLTRIRFNLSGTTNLADISNLKVYYTGTSPRLNLTTPFDTLPVASGTMEANGSQVLAEGVNYFWITASLSDSAAEGHFLKGGIELITAGGQDHVITPGTNTDQRLIILEHKLLFSGGDYGSVNFRIPAITTALDGSLVVAADARVDQPGDLPNNIDIMVRRSTDRGHTWSPAITIADFGTYGASDPALVCDRSNGNLLCMFASHQGLMLSTALNPIRYQVCISQDYGITWSAPVEHTSQIYAPGWFAAWQASGSAHQMRNGRIVAAVGVRQGSGSTISNFMIYSDDGGQSWSYKPAVASAVGDEAKIVELDNGDLMMNIRNQTPDCRKIVISHDGGNTWGTQYYQNTLIDPFVNGDFIRYTSVLDGYDKSRLLFSIASHPNTRKNLTIFLSYDEASTWTVSKVINPGMSGYSALTVLDDGTIGCFYENGEYEDYQLYFARISLDFLSDSNDTYTFPTAIRGRVEPPFSINIFPNPINNFIEVVYEFSNDAEIDACVVDVTGQEVIRVADNERVSGIWRYTVDVSSLLPGIYFLKTRVNGVITTKKMMVVR